MLQKKKEMQIMKIKIIFFDSHNDTASTRNDTATAIFEWPYHCEGGRILANISHTLFLVILRVL